MVKRLAFAINIPHFFFEVWFMICMYKLLNFPWDLMALQCVNGALIGSHSQFYDGNRTDWFVLCCCHVSEDTLIRCHKHRGFTDSLLGADTFRFDTNEFIGKKRLVSFVRGFVPVQSTAKASQQSPGWLLAQPYPQGDRQLAWLDFEPAGWAQGNGISKANTCREQAGAELLLGSQLLSCPVCCGVCAPHQPVQILCRKHIFNTFSRAFVLQNQGL